MSTRTLVLLTFCLVLAACGKVNQQNYSRLHVGMGKAEVETLLGAPSECAGALGLTSCTWGDDKAFISVQYAADQVVVFSGHGLK
ncbi:outer membrane protein assembly factor BamE [Pseudomonas sp. RIT-PI-AD]|uniref:outer membrane protein assembly factor BamE n=1 Tax=Pseudomonas sp. RIT-PI-AD TaxID=3035294 RepID=UPI0021DAAE14|nr:outer membrane protein assembly factor BamE [Pseudomonas sp. RIT-PI-AD]